MSFLIIPLGCVVVEIQLTWTNEFVHLNCFLYCLLAMFFFFLKTSLYCICIWHVFIHAACRYVHHLFVKHLHALPVLKSTLSPNSNLILSPFLTDSLLLFFLLIFIFSFLPFPFLLLQNHSSTEQVDEQEDPDVEVEICRMSEDMARDFNTHAYLHSASSSTISKFPLIEQYSNSKCNQYCRSAFLIFEQIDAIYGPP